VRNTLGIVRSIAKRSALTSTTVEEYSMHLDGRLNAFARTQALVTRDPQAGVDLEYLIVEELTTYNAREGEQIEVSGPSIRFQPKAAETLALAIHELATNAVKYGALASPQGHIEVNWRTSRKGSVPELELQWLEANGPTIDSPPLRRGFGTELLERTLAYELKATTTLIFERTGVRCTIVLPLSDQVLQPGSRP
jgi:two-component system CheB/CheR fusion protein